MRAETKDTIRLIYDSVGEADGWSNVVAALVEQSSSNTGIVAVEHLDLSKVLHHQTIGFDDAAMVDYADYFVSTDVWLASLQAKSANQFHGSTDLVKQSDYLNSELYCDWGYKQSMHHGAGAVIGTRDSLQIRISVQRSDAEGSYEPETVVNLNHLAPHLSQAVVLENRLADLEVERQSGSSMLDQMNVAALLLDEKLSILRVNGPAEDLWATHSSVFRNNAGRLSLPAPYDSLLAKHVRQSIAAGQGDSSGTGGVLEVPVADNSALQISVSPLVIDEGLISSQYRKVLALVLVKPVGQSLNRAALASLYGLTSTEVEIVVLLCKGLTPTQIAAARKTQSDTVRAQLKRVFGKTDTHSQSQLVAKVMSSIATWAPK